MFCSFFYFEIGTVVVRKMERIGRNRKFYVKIMNLDKHVLNNNICNLRYRVTVAMLPSSTFQDEVVLYWRGFLTLKLLHLEE